MSLKFEPISLDRQEDYLENLSRCPQITSDYSFLNLWAWAEEYELRWAWDGNLIWIRQSLPEEGDGLAIFKGAVNFIRQDG